MAMISGGPKNIFPTAVGLGTMVLAPIAAVVLIGAAKPVAGMAIKGVFWPVHSSEQRRPPL